MQQIYGYSRISIGIRHCIFALFFIYLLSVTLILLAVGETGPQWPPVHSGFCIAWSQESFRLLTYFLVDNLLLLVIAFLLYFRFCNVSMIA